MATTKKVVEIEIDVDSGDLKQVSKDVQGLDKGVKAAEKGTGGLARGFKGVGLAIKAAGIGLLIGVLVKLADLFGQNQGVADKFAAAMNVLSIAFNDLFNFIGDNVGTVTQYFKDLFENPGEKLREIGDTIKNYVIANVKLLIEGFGKLGEAMSFLFDGEFEKAWEVGKEGALDMGEALLKLNPATAVMVNLAETVYDNVDAITDYTKGLWENSVALVDNQKKLQLLEVETRRLQLLNQQQAELQRQIRDDETKTFDERIAANTKLGEILEDAIDIEQDAVNQRIAILQKEQELLGYKFERELEIKNLQVELLDIEERITGVKSEQQVNENALNRERKAAAEARIEETNRLFDELLALNEAELKMEQEKEAKKKKMREDAAEQTLDLASQGITLFGDIADSVFSATEEGARKAFQAQKAVQLGLAIIDGYKAITASLASAPVAIGPVPNPAGIASLAFAAASTAVNIAKIASSKFQPSGGGGGGGSGSGPRPSIPTSSPQFNTIGTANNNQLAESIAGQNAKPSRAYVVASDVSTAQALDRNKIDTASFG